MSPSLKIVSGAILTFVLWGLAELLQKGIFIVPFPLIPEFFLGITVAISFQEIIINRAYKLPFVLLLSTAVVGELTSQLFLESCFSLNQIIYLYESGIIDVFKLIQIVLFFVTLSVFASGFTSITHQVLLLLAAILMLPIHLLHFDYIDSQLMIYGWFVAIGVLSMIFRNYKSTTRIRMESISNVFIGLGVIHLLSIISLLLNS